MLMGNGMAWNCDVCKEFEMQSLYAIIDTCPNVV